MNCIHCGKEIEDGMKLCAECEDSQDACRRFAAAQIKPCQESGSAQETNVENQAKVGDGDSPKDDKKKRKHKKGTLKKFLVFVAILAAVEFGYILAAVELGYDCSSGEYGKVYVFGVGDYISNVSDIIRVGSEFLFGGHRYRVVWGGRISEKDARLVRKARMENKVIGRYSVCCFFIVHEKYSILYFEDSLTDESITCHVQQID